MFSMQSVPVMTIDGPSGSGKGTIGLRVAAQLGWHYLDSGALYRVLALAAMNQGVALSDAGALQVLAAGLDVQFTNEVLLAGHPVTEVIRSESCGNAASQIAVFPNVRLALLERQLTFCKPPGLVADGRDMGTVVFPGAFLKIFLEAKAEERAKRRYLELKDRGQNVTLEGLIEEIRVRDVRDRGRVTAPLEPAKGAVVIETTGMGIEQVFDRVLYEVSLRLC